MKQQKIINFLLNNQGYLKKGPQYLANKFNISTKLSSQLLKEAKQQINKEFETELVVNKPKVTKSVNRLIIGDLHAPFILDGYLEWCKQLYKEYNCNEVMFIGDLIDSHSWSYHETDPDGYGVGDELEAAKRQLKLAYKLFPNADVCLGNHDLLIARKAKTAGLSRHFLKDFRDVIEAPKTWNFAHEYTYNGVRFTHGSIGNAFTRAISSRVSTVQGHLHSQSFVEYSVSEKDAIFGLQIGAGIDYRKYAFEYAKPMTKKPVISAGLLLQNDTVPLLRLMPL